MQKYQKFIFSLLIMIVLFFTACSIQTRYEVLSFIFDGVPDPNNSENIEIKDSAVIDSTKILNIAANINKPKTYFHPPYQERSCNSCHNNNTGQVLMPQPGLCYSCHENFEDNYSVIHGPVAGGYCTACHNPHKSKLQNLLLKKGKALCFNCHNPQIADNDIHSVAETSNCTSCHNPHGEENTYLLKKGSCYVCHDDFSKTYKYLHGPVSNGLCNACHATHNSKTEYKLLLSGQNLCFKCHIKKSVLKNENHEGIGDADCIECHNPHGGDDKYILN